MTTVIATENGRKHEHISDAIAKALQMLNITVQKSRT